MKQTEKSIFLLLIMAGSLAIKGLPKIAGGGV